MRERGRGLRLLWPLGPVPLLVTGALVLGVTLVGTVDMQSWAFQEWERTSSEFMWQLALAGPVAAAGATYYAGRLSAPTRVFAVRPGGRPAAAVLRRHLLLLLGAVLGGYALALAPLLWTTAGAAQSGGPDLLSMTTGVVGLVVAVLLGYLVGAWGRTAVLAPATFVGVLGLSVVGTTGLSRLSPVPERVLALGERPSAPLFAFRLAVLVLLAAVAVALAHSLLATGRRQVPRALLPALLVLAAALTVPALRQPGVSSYDPDPPTVCRESAGVEYCVHAGHRAQLEEFVAGGTGVVRTWGSAPERVRLVHERALLGTGRPGQQVVRPSIEPYLSVAPQVAVDVAAVLVGTEACFARYGAEVPPDVQDFTGELSDWLLTGATEDGSATRQPFRGAAPGDVQRWLAEHDADVATCSADLSSLPT